MSNSLCTIMKPVFVVFMSLVMLASISVGCSSNHEEGTQHEHNTNTTDSPQLSDGMSSIEIMGFPNLSETIPGIDNIVLRDGYIYFTSIDISENDSRVLVSSIHKINIDGTGLEKLYDYTPPFEKPLHIDICEFVIVDMSFDRHGNLWVAEAVNFYEFDIPSYYDIDDMTEDELWFYMRMLDRVSVIRKLDATGSEKDILDISVFGSNDEWHGVNAFNIDNAGNMYVISGNAVYILNEERKLQFNLALNGWPDSLILLQDGTMAVPDWHESKQVLSIIDAESRDWKTHLEMPRNAAHIFSGNDKYLFTYIDGVVLYGIDANNDEVQIFDFLSINVNPGFISNLLFLPDSRIILTNLFRESFADVLRTNLYMIDEIPRQDSGEKRILTLAARFGTDVNLLNAVMQFNSTSRTHSIEIIDYSEFDTVEGGWMGSLDRLALDIVTGNAPDIIEVSYVPYRQWAARGLFVDLYPFIDNDPVLSRSDVIESILKSTEINGRLYQIISDFGINTLVGHSSVVGSNMGWSWSEFKSVLDANPQADWPIGGAGFSNELALAVWLSWNVDNYINWDTGVANFDSAEFIELLELFSMFPNHLDFDQDWDSLWLHMTIANRRQLVSEENFYSFSDFLRLYASFGGDFTFKGYPRESGIGNVLSIGSGFAITEPSNEKEAAWEFVRMFMTEEWQRRSISMGHGMFPTNVNVFDELLTTAMSSTGGGTIEIGGGLTVQNRPLTQDEANKIMDMIDSLSNMGGIISRSLENIILESAIDYFHGRITAQDAARIIQNRASIFMAEQSG